jgi:NAD(P)H-dependent flavin oxidoreductase YrpB (nitropropane dioxygenase family)
MAAALAAGASGVRVGTRFVAAEEAGAHPVYLSALCRGRAEDTVYTEAFGANWPNAPHRVLRASLEAAQRFEGDVVAEFTGPYTGVHRVVHPFDAAAPARYYTGHIDAMPHWAGEGVGAVRRVQPAAEIIREIAGEAEDLLKRWG